MPNEKERVLYEGGPSQMINYNTFTTCGLIFILAVFAPSIWDKILKYHFHDRAMYINISKLMFFVPVVWSSIAWFKVKSHRYLITNERFLQTTGMFSRTTHELELFRVKDITLLEPFSLRMIGCGNIIMDTTDKSTPVVALNSIRNPRPVIEILRKNIEIMRSKRGVREIGV